MFLCVTKNTFKKKYIKGTQPEQSHGIFKGK